MKPLMRVMLVAVVAALSLSVVAQAAHKPGHGGGPPPGGGGGGAALTINAAPNPIVFGNTTTISGQLKGAGAGVTVQLRADTFPYDGNFQVLNGVTAVTDNGGRFTFPAQRPAQNTSYQAVATTGGTTTVSAPVIVNVRIRLGLRVSDATPRVGQLVTFRGRACPKHDGLLIAIKRRTATGGFVTVRRARLKTGTTACSVYARSFRIFRDGAYRVVADDADHAKGVSPTRFIDVHR